MKIWRINQDVMNFDQFMLVNENDGDFLLNFDGSSKKKEWYPIKVKRIKPKVRPNLGDTPCFYIMTLSEKAVELLRPLMDETVEVLELDFEEKYYAINVTTVLDVIDYEKSKYKTFKSSGRIMRFEKYVFRDIPTLRKYNIFKIPDETNSAPFVSERFKKLVEDSGLEGFKFELVWDSEAIQEPEEIEEISNTTPQKTEIEGDFFNIVKPMGAEVLKEIKTSSKTAEKIFKLKIRDNKQVAEQIDKIVCDIIKTGEYPSEYPAIETVAVGLGTVLGNAISAQYHWKWMDFGNEDDGKIYHGLVSPGKFYTFAPMEYIYGFLSSDEDEVDVTVALLFNMMKTIEDKPGNMRYALIM